MLCRFTIVFMDTQFRRITIEGGNITADMNDELRCTLKKVKATWRLINTDKVSIRITAHATCKRNSKGAKGHIKCFHHEDAAQFLEALDYSGRSFETETKFIPAQYVCGRESKNFPSSISL